MHAVMPTYGRAQVSFERGEGAYLYGTDGTRYLDFAAGVAVNSLGHAHPKLVAALKAQADKVWHVSNLYQIPETIRLPERPCSASFADPPFFRPSAAAPRGGAETGARRVPAP